MEDRVKISILMDHYKVLLTEKQRGIMELYFNQDLSLAEISEFTNTSRQAVYDIIKRCNKLLLDYENKLKLAQKNEKIMKDTKLVIDKINELEEESHKKEIKDRLQEIKNIIVKNI